jgi:hypothetical protein
MPMTDHLTDNQLNEILDGRAASRHLDDCPDCRARLDDLRVLFTALESLPEAKLTRDLTASILARLPQRHDSPAWRWLFAAQIVGAIAITAWLASSFEMPTIILAYQPPSLDSLLASLFVFLSSFSFELPTFDLQLTIINLQLPTFNLELSTFNLTLLIVSTAALWVVGNSLLLRTPARNSR